MARAIFYQNPGDYQPFDPVAATQGVTPGTPSRGINPALMQAALMSASGAMGQQQQQGPVNISPQKSPTPMAQNFGATNPIYLQLMQLAQQLGKGIPLNQPQLRR